VSDEELRALARDTSPAGRIKHARALERVGQRGDALSVLVPAREDPDVRRVLAELPAWRHENGDGGNTRSVDVAPLRSRPVVRWTVEGRLDPDRGYQLHLVFLATPFVVVASTAPGIAGVFDAETGELRWSFAVGDHLRDSRPAIVGDRIVIPYGEEVFADDLWTGKELGRARVPGLWELHRGDLLVAKEGRDLALRRWRDPRSAPEDLWRIEIGHTPLQQADRYLVTDELLLLARPDDLLGVDLATGQEVFRERNAILLAADERGVLALKGGRGLVERRPSGEWHGLGTYAASVQALGSEVIHAGVNDSAQLIDRVSGVMHPVRPLAGWASVAIARDVLFDAFPGEVTAVTADGQVLWSVARASGSAADDVFAVIPAHERLYTYARDGTVTCYEAADSQPEREK
jgi:outer membrane protein assembly factor BamB